MLEVLMLVLDWLIEVHDTLSLNTSLVLPLALPFEQSQAIYLQQCTLCHRATYTHTRTHTYTYHPKPLHNPPRWRAHTHPVT